MKKYVVVIFMTTILLVNTSNTHGENSTNTNTTYDSQKFSVGLVIEQAQKDFNEMKLSNRFGDMYIAKLTTLLNEAQKSYKSKFYRSAYLYAKEITNEKNVRMIHITEIKEESERAVTTAQNMYNLLPEGEFKEEVMINIMGALNALNDRLWSNAYLSARKAIDMMNYHVEWKRAY